MASFVRKFDSAVGSKPDGTNLPINAIDSYSADRFSSDADKAFFEGVFNKVIKNIVALDLGFYKGKERRTIFTLSFSARTGPIECHVDKQTGEKHYDNSKKVPDGYEAIGGYESSGTTGGFQRFVFKKPIAAKSIRVAFDKNTDGSSWLSIVGARAILGSEVTDIPPGPDNGSVTPIDPDTDTDPQPPTPPTPKPEPDQTVKGVKIPYAVTGKTRTEGWNYNENDGLRIDYEHNKFPDFVNNAMVVYGQFVGKVTEDEERGFKWSWATHTGSGTLVNTYMVATKNGSGKCRARFEEDHPHGYSTLIEQGTGLGAKTGKIWGLMGIRKNVVDAAGKVTGVLLELWEDQGGMLADGKPANKWKKLLSHVDTKWMITDYSKDGIECTCRMDDDRGDKNIKVEKVLLVELAA
ncbi:MAG: hypothetical protein L0H53_03530 [Candidatus Nitrosocosmicus sp.]|nr:hypothetical protein [Candidatus Nitrosocosmicus sp.]MDN5865942.1 hypothetical protein [Candidatus Nitrosocosmicus sp.]